VATSTQVRPSDPGKGIRPRGVSIAVWSAVALVGAVCWSVLALSRGEEISALWILFAALSSYAIAYRFYARFIAYRVLAVDDTRATPAERLENGVDYDVTDRRVLFGHHFAAIAGAGPLGGPVLAAQMGYLPGTIWIVVGVILAGAVLIVAPGRLGLSLDLGLVLGVGAVLGGGGLLVSRMRERSTDDGDDGAVV